MHNHASEEHEGSALFSWLIIGSISIGIMVWAFVMFMVVGDKGPPAWDYRVVEDVPGESPYSTATPKQFPGPVPHPQAGGGEYVQRQHVDKRREGPAVMQQEGRR